MKKIRWSELPGNKFLKKIEPELFENKKIVHLQTIRLVGKTRSNSRETVKVIYDRDYLFNKLAIEVIEPLEIRSLDQLLKVMVAVWGSYCQQTKKAG